MDKPVSQEEYSKSPSSIETPVETRPPFSNIVSERRRPRRRVSHRVIAAVSGIALAAGAAVVSVNALNNDGPENNPGTTGEPVVPGPDVTSEPTTEQPSAQPEVETVPAELEQYESMSVEAFNELEKSEQALYVSFLYKDLESFAAEWIDQKAQSTDIYTPASEDMSPQEALTNSRWMHRYLFSLTKEDALKALSFLTFDKNVVTTPDQYAIETIESFQEANPRGLAEANILPIGVVQNPEEIIIEEVGGFPAMRGISLNFEGNPVFEDEGFFLADIYYGSFNSYDNKTFQFWASF